MQCIYCIMKQSLFSRAHSKERTHLKGTFFNTKTMMSCRLDATIERSLGGNSAFDIHPSFVTSTFVTSTIVAFPRR